MKVVVGCNNDVGGFHENLVTFRDSKWPDFELVEKMRRKKCSSWCNNKNGKSASVSQKREMVEDPRRIERNQLKLGLNPHVLAYSVVGGGGRGSSGIFRGL